MTTVAELRKQRGTAYDAFKVLAEKPALTTEERAQYDTAKTAVTGLDDQIGRALDQQQLAASTAQPVAGQERASVPASLENSPYVSDEAAKRLARARGFMEGSARSIVFGGMIRMIGAAGAGGVREARALATDLFGEAHPTTRAMITASGAAGGFIVPPDFMPDVIELLRAKAVVRRAGPRVVPMPRGTMTMPGQASAATAGYSGEVSVITASQPGLNQIVASFKKLTGLVPVSNDMLRYADPAADAFVRDDLVKVVALREDLAFLLGDGTLNTPRGYTSFANGFALQGGGTAGNWISTAASTAAAGGNFITSTEAYTIATVNAEIGGAANKLDVANVPDEKRAWFMHPRTRNYLFDAQNSLGLFVWRDEVKDGKLRNYPIFTTSQIPVNIETPDTTYTDGSFLMLAEMTESMLFDAMTLELAVSREGSYVDTGGATVNAFAQDQTIIRAIEEHDFQMRHDAAVAIVQFVRWAPANA